MFTYLNLQPAFLAAFKSLSESPTIRDWDKLMFLINACSINKPGFGFLQKQSFLRTLISFSKPIWGWCGQKVTTSILRPLDKQYLITILEEN